MVVVKKEVLDHCTKFINKEIDSARVEIRRNKAEIKRLAERQRILKASLGELYHFTWTLKNKQ